MARKSVMGPGPGEVEGREPEPPEEEQPKPPRRPEPEPEPEPARRTVEIGGRKFEVDRELGEALDAYRTDSEDRFGKQQRAIEELYGRIPRPAEPQAVEPNFDTLLFEKPSEALRLHGERIKRELQEQYAQDQTAQTQQRVMEKFWFDFYQDHPEMREDDVVVRSMFGANFQNLLDMTPAKAREELAKMTRGELTKIAARYAPGEQPVQLEGGSRTRTRAPGPNPPAAQGPRTLSEALKMRREARLRPIRREAG